MSEYVSISQAVDWFWVDPDSIVYRVAVWATRTDGKVVGLLPVLTEGALLTPPPPIKGIYKHESELTAEEKNILARYQDETDIN